MFEVVGRLADRSQGTWVLVISKAGTWCHGNMAPTLPLLFLWLMKMTNWINIHLIFQWFCGLLKTTKIFVGCDISSSSPRLALSHKISVLFRELSLFFPGMPTQGWKAQFTNTFIYSAKCWETAFVKGSSEKLASGLGISHILQFSFVKFLITEIALWLFLKLFGAGREWEGWLISILPNQTWQWHVSAGLLSFRAAPCLSQGPSPMSLNSHFTNTWHEFKSELGWIVINPTEQIYCPPRTASRVVYFLTDDSGLWSPYICRKSLP